MDSTNDTLDQNNLTPDQSNLTPDSSGVNPPVSSPAKDTRPDFIMNTLSGDIKGLQDVTQSGYSAQDFKIHDKDYYWNNPKTRDVIKNKFGISDYKEYTERYGQALGLYNMAEQGQTSFDRGSESTVMDSPDARKYHMKIKHGPEAVYTGTDVDHSLLSAKEAAIAKGVKKADGSIDFNFNKSFTDVAFGKGYELASNPDGSPVLDQRGYGEFKEMDSSKPVDNPENILKPWESAPLIDTFLNGDGKDESAVSTFTRNLGKFVPDTAAIPFVMDATEGVFQLIKTINHLTGDSEGVDESMNKKINYLKRWSFDHTIDETAHPYQMKSIIANTANIVSMLSGMSAIGKAIGASTEGVLGLFGAAAKEKGAVSAASAIIGSQASLFSMGAQASAGFAEEAEKAGINKTDAALMHLGMVGTYMYIGKLSELIYGPMVNKVETKLVRDQMMDSIGYLANATKGAEGEEVAGIASNKFLTKYRAAKDELAKLQGELPKFYDTAEATYHGAKEMALLTSAEQAWKSSYNVYQDYLNKGATPGKGKFEPVDMDSFAAKLASSAFFGGLGGAFVKGMGHTTLGKEFFGYDSTIPSLGKDAFEMAADPYTSSLVEKNLTDPNFSLVKNKGSKNVTYTKDENGNWKPPVPDSVDPLERYSQNEVNLMVYKSYWEFAKSQVQLSTPMENGGMLDAATRKLVVDGGKATLEGFKKDAADAINNRLNYTQDLKKLTDLKAEESSPDLDARIKEKQAQIALNDKYLNDLVTGRESTHYYKKSLFDHLPTINVDAKGNKLPSTHPDFFSFDSYLAQEKEYALNVEKARTILDERSQAVEKRSNDAMLQTNVFDADKIAGNSPINDAAKAHISNLVKIERGLQVENAKIEARDRILKKTGQTELTPEQEKAISKLSRVDQVQMLLPDKDGFSIFDVDSTPTKKDGEEEAAFAARVDATRVNGETDNEFISRLEAKHYQLQNIEKKKAASLADINPTTYPFDVFKGNFTDTILDNEEADYAVRKETYHSVDKVPLAIKEDVLNKMHFLGAAIELNPLVSAFREQFKDQLNDDKDSIRLISPKTVGLRTAVWKELDPLKHKELLEEATKSEKEDLAIYVKKLEQLDERWKRANRLAKADDANSFDPIEATNKKNATVLKRQFTEIHQNVIANLGITEFQSPELEELAGKLRVKAPMEFQERQLLTTQYFQALSKIWNSPELSKTGRISRKSITDKLAKVTGISQKLETLHAIMKLKFNLEIDHLKFNEDLSELIKENMEKGTNKGVSPTFEQREVIKQLLSTTLTRLKGKDTTLDDFLGDVITKMYDPTQFSKDSTVPVYYNDFITMFGTWGSGKSSFVPWYFLDMLGKELKNTPEAPSGVITAANIVAQRDNLNKNLTDRGLTPIEIGNNGSFTIDDLIEAVRNRDTKLNKAAIVALYDEATFIPKDKVLELHRELQQYNDSRNTRLQVVFIGDNLQGGYNETTPDEDGAPRVQNMNIGNDSLFPGLIQTNRLEFSQRTGSLPIADFLATMTQKTKKGDFQNQEVKTIWGTDASGKLSGMRIVDGKTLTEDTPEGGLNLWLHNIQEQKAANNDAYKAAYITDRDLSSPEMQAIEQRIKDKGMGEDILIVPFNKVQGQEFKTIVVDFGKTGEADKEEGTLMYVNKKNRELEKISSISTAVSRVEDFVLFVNDAETESGFHNSNRNWSSEQSAESIKPVATKLTPEFYKKNTENTIEQLDNMITILSDGKSVPRKVVLSQENADPKVPGDLSSNKALTTYEIGKGTTIIEGLWNKLVPEGSINPADAVVFKEQLDNQMEEFSKLPTDEARRQFIAENEIIHELNNYLHEVWGNERWEEGDISPYLVEFSDPDFNFPEADFNRLEDEVIESETMEMLSSSEEGPLEGVAYDLSGETLEYIEQELQDWYDVAPEIELMSIDDIPDEFKPSEGEETIDVVVKTKVPLITLNPVSSGIKGLEEIRTSLSTSLDGLISGKTTTDQFVGELERIFGKENVSNIRELFKNLPVSAVKSSKSKGFTFRYDTTGKATRNTLSISTDKVLDALDSLTSNSNIDEAKSKFIKETLENELVRATLSLYPPDPKLVHDVRVNITDEKVKTLNDVYRFIAKAISDPKTMGTVVDSTYLRDAIDELFKANDSEYAGVSKLFEDAYNNYDSKETTASSSGKPKLKDIPKIQVAKIGVSKLDAFKGTSTNEFIKLQAEQKLHDLEALRNKKLAGKGKAHEADTTDPNDKVEGVPEDVEDDNQRNLKDSSDAMIPTYTWVVPNMVKTKNVDDFFATHEVKAKVLAKIRDYETQGSKIFLKSGNILRMEHSTGKAKIDYPNLLNHDTLYLTTTGKRSNGTTYDIILATFPVDTTRIKGFMDVVSKSGGIDITSKFLNAREGGKDVVVGAGNPNIMKKKNGRITIKELMNKHSDKPEVNPELLPPMHFSKLFLDTSTSGSAIPVVFYSYNKSNIDMLHSEFKTGTHINEAFLKSNGIGRIPLDNVSRGLTDIKEMIPVLEGVKSTEVMSPNTKRQFLLTVREMYNNATDVPYKAFLSDLLTKFKIYDKGLGRQMREVKITQGNMDAKLKTDGAVDWRTGGDGFLSLLKNNDTAILEKFDSELKKTKSFPKGIMGNVDRDRIETLSAHKGLMATKESESSLSLLTTNYGKLSAPVIKFSPEFLSDVTGLKTKPDPMQIIPQTPGEGVPQPKTSQNIELEADSARKVTLKGMLPELIKQHVDDLKELKAQAVILGDDDLVATLAADILKADKVWRTAQRNPVKNAGTVLHEATTNIGNILPKITGLDLSPNSEISKLHQQLVEATKVGDISTAKNLMSDIAEATGDHPDIAKLVTKMLISLKVC